jgi:general stress protein 26
MLEEINRAWDLAKKFHVCFLTTQSAVGAMKAQPMTPIVKEDEGRVLFFAEADCEAATNIAQKEDVLLCFTDGGATFLTIAAKAHINKDRQARSENWNAGAQAFWPAGPTTPNVVLVEAEALGAEYWEGSSRIIALAKLATAIVTAKRPDLGNHGAVALG